LPADDLDVLAPRLPGAARGLLLGCLALLATGVSQAGAATAASTAVSSNWAGYVAQPAAPAGSRFTSVSGTWTVPHVSCAAGHSSYSAVWVGLGGYREAARSLEQVGVDADCSPTGRPRYASWYELLPAAPIALALSIHPGDRVSASVTAKGRVVTLRLRDLTSSARFSTTKRPARIDRSSAEWIVEAPSECSSSGSCSTLALSDFGAVPFAAASATMSGHTGALSDPLWSLTALELRQSGAPRVQASGMQVLATPTAPSQSDGSFAVGWREEAAQGEAPSAPALPSLAGGTG
jgi:hypothetical protein